MRTVLAQCLRDLPPVAVLLAVAVLDGVEGVAGVLVAGGAYAVSLVVWTLVGPARGRGARRRRQIGSLPTPGERSLAVSGIFLALLVLRGRQVGPILTVMFAVAAAVTVVPMPGLLKGAIVLVLPASLVYATCERRRPQGSA